VLVTGAAGFIGSHILRYLKLRGYRVLGIDSFERASPECVEELKAVNAKVIKGDIRDLDLLRKLLRGFNAVIHAAAYVDVAESVREPIKYIANNVIGTAVVAEASATARVKRLIYLSSAAIYGEPVKIPVTEDHPARPKSPYGLSKLLGEEILKFYSSWKGLESVVLRLFNVYGLGQSRPYTGVITEFVRRATRCEPPIIFGDGNQIRDFVNVVDVARAVELSLRTELPARFVAINIGTGRAVSIAELARLVAELSGARVQPIYSSPREGDIRYSLVDISRAKKILKWEPMIDLEEGVTELLRWFNRKVRPQPRGRGS